MSCKPNGHYYIGDAGFCACGSVQRHVRLKDGQIQWERPKDVDYGPEKPRWKNEFGCECRSPDACHICNPGQYLGIVGDLTKTPHTIRK